MATIEAWVDGACDKLRNGGWAVIIKLPDSPFIDSIVGSQIDTTSQRMEMTSLLRVLEHFEEPRHFIIHSDSAYVVNCFQQKWIAGWRRKGWINSKGKPVVNRDLWELLEEQVERHLSVRFIKVKGHSGSKYNDMADKLAVRARKDLKRWS
jgi:ribonuclease HI